MSNMTIGERISEIRGKEARHSFAKKLGIGTATLQRYENGERMPDLVCLGKLQEMTGLSLDYLVNGIQTEQSPLTTDEAFLLQEFRSLPDDQKKLMLRFLLAGFDGLHGSVINSPNAKIENSFNN